MANPIEMPNPLPISSKVFDLSNSGQLITPVGSGWIQTIERVRPYWVANYESPPLNNTRYGLMQTFLDALEGSKNTFLGFDPRRMMPLAAIEAGLPLGSTPWSSATLTGSSFSGSSLAVALGASYTISRGDYLSVLWNGAWYLFRSRSQTTGTNHTVTVSPRPKDGMSGTLRLARAAAEMKMIGAPKWTDSVDSLPRVTFNAVQYVERATP